MIENNGRFSSVVVGLYLKDHDVTIVPSIKGARQKLSRYRYDLFLVDYDLDDGKGDCIVKEIKQISHHYPIIAISAFDSKNELLMATGADFKCSKLHFGKINHIGPLVKTPGG